MIERKKHYTDPRSHRVVLTDALRANFEEKVFNRPVTELVAETGLPYLLVYNIVHHRVHSVSPRHFRLLFGEDPPTDRIFRVDGTHFRRMADLWVYLNDETTKTALYSELTDNEPAHKPDYRIFSGKIATVDKTLEEKMAQKFVEAGIDRDTLRDWLDEWSALPESDRVPYHSVKPLLLFLKQHAGIHPNAILHQQMDRYESGRLKSVSRSVFEQAVRLKNEAERATGPARSYDLERLREKVYGKKSGYTLFSAVEEELRFLAMVADKRPKRYLGRGIKAYEQGKCKRIASWRAQKIRNDCSSYVADHPSIDVRSLPRHQRTSIIAPLLDLLLRRAADILSRKEGMVLEKQILSPSRTRTEYVKATYGFTRFDRAPTALGMKKGAFDLMVAHNCDIFRRVGKYAQRWYLSDLYLEELAGKAGFGVISAKYELLSKRVGRTPPPVTACLN